MVIGFETRQLRCICESEKLLQKHFGAEIAVLVRARMADFRAARSLQDILDMGLLQMIETQVGGVVALQGKGLKIVLKSVSDSVSTGEGGNPWRRITRVKFMSIELVNA